MRRGRYELRKELNAQRTLDAKSGTYALAGGVVDPIPEDAPQFVKDYYDYYKTKRGIPQAFAQLERWMEQNIGSVVSQHTVAYLQR